MAMEVENNRTYVDIGLFKGDFCARLSPDLLQQEAIYTQTDDESSSECSAHSAATILRKNQSNSDLEEVQSEDETANPVSSLSLHLLSSEEDNSGPAEKLSNSNTYSDTLERSSPSLLEYIPDSIESYFSSVKGKPSTFTSKNKSTPEICSRMPVKNIRASGNKSSKDRPSTSVVNSSPSNSTISSSEEVIPPSPTHSIISSDSTNSTKSTKQKSKKSWKKVIDLNNDDSTDPLSDTDSVNKRKTVQRRMKKDKSSITKRTSPRKPQPKGKKKIVMNKVVYPSSYPTSAEESDDSFNISSINKPKLLRSKLLPNRKSHNKNSSVILLSEDDS